MQINDIAIMTDNALDNYGEEYRDKVFTITHKATNTDQHPGYDNSVFPDPLYDLSLDGEDFPNSLYDYELIEQ